MNDKKTLDRNKFDDDKLFNLFKKGTAPDSELAFVERVVRDIGQSTQLARLNLAIKIATFMLFTLWSSLFLDFYFPLISLSIETIFSWLDDFFVQAGIGLFCVIVMRRFQPIR